MAAPDPGALVLTVRVFGDNREGRSWSVEVQKKDLAFDPKQKVSDVKRIIEERTNVSGAEFGIYKPPGMTMGQWMEDSNTLWHYQLQNRDEIHFKLRLRPLRIHIQEQIKIVKVDEAMQAKDIVIEISKMLRPPLGNPEEYGLKRIGDERNNTAWILPLQTLIGANIGPDEELTLLKKLYFYDKTLTKDDTSATGLLYSQNKQDILAGVLEIHTLEEAVEYAALIMHISFGPYNYDTMQAGSSLLAGDNMLTVLPATWVARRTPAMEADIYKKYITLRPPRGASKEDVDNKSIQPHHAMEKFNKLCLATNPKLYGLAYFTVTRKVMKGLIRKQAGQEEQIFAVGRDSVMFFDIRNHSIIMEHSYTELEKHYNDGGQMKLDFGDYEDELVTFATRDADQITAYIRGYIDLYKKFVGRQRGLLEPPPEIPNDTPTTEAPVKPVRNLAELKQKLEEEPPAPAPAIPAKPADPREAVDALVQSQEKLKKEVRNAALASSKLMLAALDDVNDLNPTDLLAAARSLNDALNKLVGESKVAAVMSSGDEAQRADDMSKDVKRMVTAALLCAQSLESGALDGSYMADLLAAAKDVGDAMRKLLGMPLLGLEDGDADADPLYGDLLDAARALQEAMAALIDQTKTSKPDKVAALEAIKKELDQIDAMSSLMSASMKDPFVHEKIKGLLGAVQLKLDALLDQLTGDDDLLAAARALRDALAAMIGAVDAMHAPPDHSREIEEASIEVANSIAELVEAAENQPKKQKMTALGKAVINNTTTLGQLVQQDAAYIEDRDSRDLLLAAAEALSAAMSKLLGDIGTFNKDLTNEEARNAVTESANGVGDSATNLMINRMRHRALLSLANWCKATCAKFDDLKRVSDDNLKVAGTIRSESRKKDLERTLGEAGEIAEAWATAARVWTAAPVQPKNQLDLMRTSALAARKMQALVLAAQDAAPQTDDFQRLNERAEALAACLKNLVDALAFSREATWDLDVEVALASLAATGVAVDAMTTELAAGRVVPTAGVTQQMAQDNMVDRTIAINKRAEEATKAVLAEAKKRQAAQANKGKEGADTSASGSSKGHAAEMASALKVLAAEVAAMVEQARDVAATTKNPEHQHAVLVEARNLTKDAAQHVKACKNGLLHPQSTFAAETMEAMRQQLEEAVRQLLNALPGQGDCQHAIEVIQVAVDHTTMESLPNPEHLASFSEYTSGLDTAAKTLAAAAKRLHEAANTSPDDLGEAARRIEGLAISLLEAAEAAAAVTSVESAQPSIVDAARTVGEKVIQALAAAKVVGGDNDNTEAPKVLTAAIDSLADSLAHLLAALKSGENTVGVHTADCNKAVGIIRDASAKLTAGVLPAPSGTFKQNQDALLAATQALVAEVPQVAMTARGDPTKTGKVALASAMQVAAVAEAALAAVAAMATPASAAAPGALNAEEVTAGSKKCMDGLAAMLKTDKKPDVDAKSLMRTVAIVAKAVVAFTKLLKDAAPNLDPAVGAPLTAACDDLVAHVTSMVKAADAHSKDLTDQALQTKFLGKAKSVAVGTSKLTEQGKAAAPAAPEAAAGAASPGKNLLLETANKVAMAVSALINGAKLVASDTADKAAGQLLNNTVGPVNEAVDALVAACRVAGPGQLECDHAVKAADALATKLHEALLALSVGDLTTTASDDHSKYVNGLLNAAKALSNALNKLLEQSKTSAEGMGPAAMEVERILEALGVFAKKAASTTGSTTEAGLILRVAKDLAEEVKMTVAACRQAGGSTENAAAVGQAEEGVRITAETIAGLLQHIQSLAARGHDCDIAIGDVNKAVAALEKPPVATNTFAEFEKELKQAAKRLVGEMSKTVEAASADPENVGAEVKNAAATLLPLMQALAGELSLLNDDAMKNELLDAARALAEALRKFIEASRRVQNEPASAEAKSALSAESTSLTTGIAAVLRASKKAGLIQRETDDAVRLIEEAVVELNTSDYLASNNQLYAHKGGDYRKYEKKVDAVCKALAHHVSGLLEKAKTDQATLDKEAMEAAGTVGKLVEAVIAAAGMLESQSDQRDLLTAARALAKAMSDLINAGQGAFDQKATGAGDKKFKADAKAVALAIAAQINTALKAREAATAGIKALEAAAALVAEAIAALEAAQPATKSTPQEAMTAAREVTNTSTKLYFAAKKTQAAIAERAGVAGDAAKKLGLLTLGLLGDITSDDMRAQLLAAAKAVANAVNSLIGQMSTEGTTQTQLDATSKEISQNVAAYLSKCSALMRGATGNEDANDSAERELLDAAEAIEAAARKLLELRAPAPKLQTAAATENLRVAESILGACRSIAEAAAQLVKAASAAQQEIVRDGKAFEGNKYKADPRWAEGLISAAREVVAATDLLVLHAQAFVTGECDETYLVAASQMIASGTAHLVAAAKAKAKNLGSAPQVALGTAAKNIRTATQALIKSATEASNVVVEEVEGDEQGEERELSFKEKMEARENRAKIEKQLEDLRRGLNKKPA